LIAGRFVEPECSVETNGKQLFLSRQAGEESEADFNFFANFAPFA
jgi:hypothetical protein